MRKVIIENCDTVHDWVTKVKNRYTVVSILEHFGINQDDIITIYEKEGDTPETVIEVLNCCYGTLDIRDDRYIVHEVKVNKVICFFRKVTGDLSKYKKVNNDRVKNIRQY